MKKPILMLLTIVSLTGIKALQAQMPVEQWARNHPEASHALGEWVKTYPQAARYMF